MSTSKTSRESNVKICKNHIDQNRQKCGHAKESEFISFFFCSSKGPCRNQEDATIFVEVTQTLE